jgi:hypothetical protein
MWEYIVKPGRPQMTIWCMHIACGMPKATNTLAECVILIVFPVLQLLHKCASLRYSTELAIFYKIILDLSAESSAVLLCSSPEKWHFNTRFYLPE